MQTMQSRWTARVAVAAALAMGASAGYWWTPQVAAQATMRIFGTLEGTENNPTILPVLINADGEVIVSGGGGGTPGGSNGDLQYNNAGAFGGYTPGSGVVTWLQTPSSANLAAAVTGETGSGALVFGTSPSFTTSGTLTRDSIGATSTDGWVLQNTTAASAGAQQWSPRLRLTGQGWKTNATAASQQVDWAVEAVPIQGSASPLAALQFASQVNSGGYAAQATIGNAGIAFPSTSTSFLSGLNGIYSTSSYPFVFATGGTQRLAISSGQVIASSGGSFGISSSSTVGSAADVILLRDAAATFGQRDGTNAQAFRLYETYTDSSNYERLAFTTGSDTLSILAETAGTGSDNLNLVLAAAGTGIVSSSSTFKAAGYQSSDGSAGVTVTTCTSFKNGLCVAGT